MSTFEVINPATGELVRNVAITTSDEVGAMVQRARYVQKSWAELGFEGRGEVLRRAQKWVHAHTEEIISTIVSETGKTYEDALLAEVSYVANGLGFWAKHAPKYLADEHIHNSNPFLVGRRLTVRYCPIGVVGVIGPWNYPLLNSFGDCIPALAAGNAVILKPSPATPLTSLLMRECMIASGLDKDLFQVANGDAETGEALIDGVDMIMFTGSTKTGRQVAKRAAERLIPVSLELGGKDPMLVLSDADVAAAAHAAVFYSMQNAGQTCISIERVYVETSVYDEFVRRVNRIVESLRLGAPDGPGSVDIGAITVHSQHEIISAQVDQASAAGAHLYVGKRAITDGDHRLNENFYPPTVLLDVDHTMVCMREETFGPVLPIMKVADETEAIRLANDSIYGLAASVWTKSTARGERVARLIEAGVVSVNDAVSFYLAQELPMGGWKGSGIGYRHGAPGIRKYCRQQSLMIGRFAPRRHLYMFPYNKHRARVLKAASKLLFRSGKP